VRVATFNLMHGRSLRDGRVDPARFRDAVAALDADVLALQEVDRAQPRSLRLDLAREAAEAVGAQYRFVPALYGTPGHDWRAADHRAEPPGDGGPAYGIALLSRLPVTTWWVRRLPAAPVRSPLLLPGPTPRVVLMRDEPRVVLAARVDTPAGPLTVATTHLSFVPGWNLVQMGRLCRWLRELPGPRLLAADLNIPGPLPGVIFGWHQLARLATYPAQRPRAQLDHVLSDPTGGPRPPVVGAYTVGTGVSDHLALVVELDDRPAPGQRRG
jgi:endonuclease/exonuclease/phosphatase family metal-dependent hydrolase